ncbi:MAG: hypothetical protein H7339_19850 [Arcicella sp.]|nr:hypothetical protein [Arcicella sp.]
MKAYNPLWSESDFIQRTAQKWLKQGFLTKVQFTEIEKMYPVNYYDSNVFLKIGLFIFTILAAGFSIGIMSIFFVDIYNSNLNVVMVIQSLMIGSVFFFLLENLIKNRQLYHSGVDNALIYMALGAFCTTIYFLFEKSNPSTWLFLILFLPLFVATTIRYAESVVCTLTYFLIVGIFVMIALESFWGKILLPFILMIVSTGMYFLVKKLSSRKDYLYYETCLTIFKTLSLITFYLGGNYLIVREGNALINNLYLSTSPQVAFAPMFYFFTTIIPIAYLFFGFRYCDRLILILGLITLGFSIFTYRFYFSIIPIEIALTLGGILLITLSAGLIHYLKTAKHGFTYQPDDDFEGFNLEAMLMSQIIQSKIPHQGDTFKFGGGDSIGGGAGGKY